MSDQYELDQLHAQIAQDRKESKKTFIYLALMILGAIGLIAFGLVYYPPFKPLNCMRGEIINDSVHLTGRLTKYNGKIDQICFDLEKEN